MGEVDEKMVRGRREEEKEEEIGWKEIKEIMKKLKDGKAMRLDEILYDIWKYGGEEVEKCACDPEAYDPESSEGNEDEEIGVQSTNEHIKVINIDDSEEEDEEDNIADSEKDEEIGVQSANGHIEFINIDDSEEEDEDNIAANENDEEIGVQSANEEDEDNIAANENDEEIGVQSANEHIEVININDSEEEDNIIDSENDDTIN
ncbi:glutamic acid-rich protein-like [Odontomachus brunneus]|uniref:glutamic acid-rich protein-like n=1 Tax=Odontomachus brunneus TaxID=486640 RepID=UPI0013F2B387|nr:glutamic acid-rich protein-like [Odontomachus brunneus]